MNNLIIFVSSSLIMSMIGIVWIIFVKQNNSLNSFITYIFVISLQQFFFSLLISLYYNYNYSFFTRENNSFQLGISIIFRSIISSLIIFLFTFFSQNYNYRIAFILYIIILIFLSIFTNYFLYKNISKRKNKKWY